MSCGGLAPSMEKATVAQVVGDYLDNLNGVSDSTASKYRGVGRKHIISNGIGGVRVGDLDHRRIEAWQRDLSSRRSASTVRGARHVLRAALNRAVVLGLIKANPITTVAGPSTKRPERVYLTKEQVSRLALAAGEYSTLILFLADTGARISEVAALHHEDVDPAKRIVRFHHNLTDRGDRSEEMKTARSRRTVTLTKRVAEKLATVVDQAKEGQPLFTSPTGRYLNRRNYLRRVFKPAAVAAGLGDIEGLVTHSLRHTSASWLLAAGVPLWRVSRRLGHSSVAITEKTYAHLIPGDQSDADALDQYRDEAV